LKGKVVNWLGSYGFIESPEQSDHIFVHFSDLEGRRELYEGEEVNFDLEKTEKGLRATNVTLITPDS
jgi:cold shock CspA family protein